LRDGEIRLVLRLVGLQGRKILRAQIACASHQEIAAVWLGAHDPHRFEPAQGRRDRRARDAKRVGKLLAREVLTLGESVLTDVVGEGGGDRGRQTGASKGGLVVIVPGRISPAESGHCNAGNCVFYSYKKQYWITPMPHRLDAYHAYVGARTTRGRNARG